MWLSKIPSDFQRLTLIIKRMQILMYIPVTLNVLGFLYREMQHNSKHKY